METSMYQSLLSKDGLKEVLSGTLQEISDKTQVPESTLRRYRNGSSDLDSIPLRTLRALSDYTINRFDVFDTPSHYFFESDIFYRILSKVRDDYNQYVDVYNAQIYFNWQHELFINHNLSMGKSQVRYFFIDNLSELLAEKPDGIDFDLLFSVGLGFGVRFIFNLEHVPVDFKWVHDGSASILSGSVLKQVTQSRLDDMSVQLSDYDGVIIQDPVKATSFLYENNVKLMVMRQVYKWIQNNADDLFVVLLKQFVKVQTSGALIGYFMLSQDEQIIYIRELIKNKMNGSIYSDKILDSLVGIILTQFSDTDYGTKLVHFV